MGSTWIMPALRTESASRLLLPALVTRLLHLASPDLRPLGVGSHIGALNSPTVSVASAGHGITSSRALLSAGMITFSTNTAARIRTTATVPIACVIGHPRLVVCSSQSPPRTPSAGSDARRSDHGSIPTERPCPQDRCTAHRIVVPTAGGRVHHPQFLTSVGITDPARCCGEPSAVQGQCEYQGNPRGVNGSPPVYVYPYPSAVNK